MYHSKLPKFGPAIALALALLSACADSPTTPTNVRAPQFNFGGLSALFCPTQDAQTATATITPLGGTVAVDGTSITFPIGAVLLPTEFTLTVPASYYMEIDITAAGSEHFNFYQPVTVSINYNRCKSYSFAKGDLLTVWYWNPQTGQLLQNMVGIDDKASRTMTFSTTHLSGYVIAN